MCYVHEQNNNDSGLFFFLGDWRGAAGGGGASRPETSWVEGSASRPAVATGGKRRRGSGRPSSGADEVLLVLVDAIVSHCDAWCGGFAPMRVDERLPTDYAMAPPLRTHASGRRRAQ